MKVSQLRQLLESAEQIYRDSGNTAAVHSLHEISSLFAGRETMAVPAFARAFPGRDESIVIGVGILV